MASKKWSDLRPGTKAKYRRAGVTPAKFNAWNKKTPAQKREYAAKAKAAGKAGTAREQFLGLRPNQISGADPMTLAARQLTLAFGDRPKFRAAGVREYLRQLKDDGDDERIKEIGRATPDTLDLDNKPYNRESSHHYH
jgi:hypothetical protein